MYEPSASNGEQLRHIMSMTMRSSVDDRPPHQQKQRGYALPPRKRKRNLTSDSCGVVKEEQISRAENRPSLDGSFGSLQQVASELDAMSVLTPELIGRAQNASAQTLQKGHNVSLGSARLVAHLLVRLTRDGVAVPRELLVGTLDALATAPRGTHDAENFLNFIREGACHLHINSYMVDQVIGSLVRSDERGSTARAEILLRQLEEAFRSTRNKHMKPNIKSYGRVIDGYAKDRQPYKAGEILTKLEHRFRSGESDVIPSVDCYSSVIDAYSRLNPPDAVEKSQAILQGLLALYRDYKREEARPDSQLFAMTISVLSKSTSKDRADRVAELVRVMHDHNVECDIFVYNTVLNVFASIGNEKSISEAETLLSSLESHPILEPDNYTYNTVLKAYSKLNGMGTKAEELLRRWFAQFQAGVVKQMPDCHSYAAVIKCWATANCKDSAEKAEEILVWMESNKVAPNNFCYGNVLLAWARSGHPEAGERAQFVFDRVPLPNALCYACLANSYARTGNRHSAEKAEKLLRESLTVGHQPKLSSCNTILSAYSRGEDARGEGGAKAEAMLDWMNSIGVEPDEVCLNSVIKAHANSNHPDRANRALGIMHRISEPTSVTFTIMVKALAGCVSLLEELFKDCTSRGLLDELLLADFRGCGVRSIAQQLETVPLPSEWTQHATRGPRGPSRRYFAINSCKSVDRGSRAEEWGW